MFKQNSLNHVCYHPNFSVMKGDVRAENTMSQLMKEVDIIIPLAALVGAPICDLILWEQAQSTMMQLY